MTLQPTDFLANKTQAFQAVRYLLQQMSLQPGVIGASDFKVSQRGSGANMSVDIAAGEAWILGASVARQGLYHQNNDAVLNVGGFSGSDATNPRIDQVFLVINDSAISGGSDAPAIVVVTGVATGGATLDNRNGAISDGTIAVSYPNRLRLADILIPAASTSVVTANIRDRRPWARGARRVIDRVTNAGGTNDYSTSSTSQGDIDATNLAPRIELSGVPVKITLRGGYFFVGGACTVEHQLIDNGSQAAGLPGIYVPSTSIGTYGDATWEMISPSAGSHVFKPGWRVDANTAKLVARAGPSSRLQLIIEETVAANGDNT